MSLLSVLLLAGCSAGGYYGDEIPSGKSAYTVEAVVTVKQDDNGTVFFQLTDTDRLFPGEYPFTRQMRAWGSLTIYPEEVPHYGNKTEVNWMEPLDEGSFVKAVPAIEKAEGIDVMRDSWVTSVEDGYLTVRYKTWWGDPAGHHDFYLVAEEPNNPFSLTLYQDVHSDGHESYSEGIICFDINSLPDTGVNYRTLTLNWITTQGKAESAKFGFKTRK